METRHFPLNLFFKAILTRISYPSNYLTFPLDFFSPEAINSPRHTPDREKTHFSKIFFLPSYSLHFFFLSPKHQKKHPKTLQKTNQSLLILPFSPRTQGIAFALNLHFLGFTFRFGVQGCGCSFLAIIHTPNLLNLFPSMFLLFLP